MEEYKSAKFATQLSLQFALGSSQFQMKRVEWNLICRSNITLRKLLVSIRRRNISSFTPSNKVITADVL